MSVAREEGDARYYSPSTRTTADPPGSLPPPPFTTSGRLAGGDGVLAPRVSSKPHRHTHFLCSHIVGEAANLFAVRRGRSRVMTAERNSRDRPLGPSVEVRPFAIPLPASPALPPCLPPSRHKSVLGNAFAFTLAAAVDARR